tara:strand:+ start:559 stop:864 length:306 start_codon:yes stop_codon:yes gene_type:complete
MKAYWKTKQGNKIEVTKLSESHIKNILFMLKRKVDFGIAVYKNYDDNVKQLTNIILNKKFKIDVAAIDVLKWYKSHLGEYEIEQMINEYGTTDIDFIVKYY